MRSLIHNRFALNLNYFQGNVYSVFQQIIICNLNYKCIELLNVSSSTIYLVTYISQIEERGILSEMC